MRTCSSNSLFWRKPANRNGEVPLILKDCFRTSQVSLVLAIAALGLLLAACGSSDSDVDSQETTDSVASDTGSSVETTEAADAVAVAEPEVEVGSDVGQMVPAFYIRDANSTKITSEEIFAKGRPSFFYFFTTW